MDRFYGFCRHERSFVGKVDIHEEAGFNKQDNLLIYTTALHRCYKDVSDVLL